MFIRSQNRQVIAEARNVYFENKEGCIVANTGSLLLKLGAYKTIERTIEVLDAIEDALCDPKVRVLIMPEE